MAAGNRHLGYKEVLNALEDRSPGTKAAFLFGFLERGHERFADDAERRARRAGARAPVRRAHARRRVRVLPARASRRRPSRCRRAPSRREGLTWPAPFAAGDRVLLVDAKRRRHLDHPRRRAAQFHTHAGVLAARRRSSAQPEGVDRAHDARTRGSSRCARRSPSTCSRCRAARR